MSSGNTLVRLEHVSLIYGDLRALDDVTLTVARGEWVCVLGANGSGKSTLASVICGLLAPDAGSVELVGERVYADGISDLAAYHRARRSLGFVFQNPDDQIVTSVVEDDIAFGPENLGVPSAQIAERVARELHRVALTGYAHADPSRLSGGQKQRVAIAGALAMEPEILVLDEPSSLLDVRGRASVLRIMERLHASGTTLVHVTHYMEEALLADRVVVLDHGRVAREGTPEEVFSTGRDTILGLGLEMPFAARLSQRLDMPLTCDEERLANAVAASFTSLPRAEKDLRASSSHVMPVAQIEHVSFAYGPRVNVLDDISFFVDEGSSTAIVGQTGSGKSTLLRLLCGLQVPDTGRVLVYGNDSSTRRGRKAVRAHVGYVMQHPERQLFAETVEKDVAFGPVNLRLPKDEVARRVDAALELVGLAGKRLNSPFELSGGQRRLCALAGILAMEPRLLVLDEPTAGPDPHGRALLREVLARLSSGGVTLIQVTHSMEDAARADHVIVLDQSRILLAGTPAEVFAPAGNEELLSKIGLGIPRSLAFARALEARGILGLGDPLTTDELLAALVKGGDRGVSA